MGREWYWGGGGGGGTKSSKRKSTSKRADGGKGMAAATAAAAAPAGCMCAVFQLFDFHQLPFSTPLNHRPSFHIPHDPPSIPKGSEAPRNSLELLEEMEDRASSLPLAVKAAPQNLNIPMGIQIKTNRGRTRPGSAGQSDSETVPSSPATKTPTLVARLMGLDLLPENQNYSPRSSASSSTTPYKLSHHLTSRPKQQGSTYSHHRRSCDDSGAGGGRSLPETPRISSARRSDVDHYHHRLSLQLNNKENANASEEQVISRIKSLRLNGRDLKPEEECRSPRQYARQIVKQVKESVSRRVGLLDITNNQMKNRDPPLPEKQRRSGGGGGGGSRRRDKDLVKSKKISKVLTRLAEEEEEEDSFVSFVPFRKDFRKDHKVLDEMSQSRKQSILSATKAPICSQPPLRNNDEESAVKLMVVSPPIAVPAGRKKGGGKRVLPPQTSDIIRNKQEEPFVRPSAGNRGGGGNIPDKRCRKTPLSSNLLQGISVPSIILPVKKDPAPPATKILSPQKQADSKRNTSAQSPSSPSHTTSYRLTSHHQQEATRPLHSQETDHQKQAAAAAAPSTAGDGPAAAAEYEYITRILKRTGIEKDTPISFTKWFSPAHPLDPTIFYHLEHITTATTTPPPSSGHVIPPSDRKLLFHLVDEILSGILKPYINVKPWTMSNPPPTAAAARGSDLINDLCRRVRSFPNADCRVLEDIDALIDKDLPERWMETAAEEEGEGIATEVEKEILESLIHETAGDVLVSLGAKRRRAVSRGHVLGREFDHVRRR